MKLRQSFEFLTTFDELGNIQNTRMSQRILGNYEPAKIRVTVAPNREKRSLDQNAYYWGFVVPPICEYTGYTPKQQDDVFQHLFAPREVKKWRGREVVTIKHCKDLSTGEFAEFLERIIAEAADMGIVIPPVDPTLSTRRLDAN
jgi:hypothetical protein